MFVAIAKPNCSVWTEPIIGSFESVISTIIEMYHDISTVVVDHHDIILKWDDPEIPDEEWWVGLVS